MLISGKTPILADEKMRELGFTDRVNSRWYRTVRLACGISFDVTIDKSSGDYEEYVLDNEFMQPYHYMTYDVELARTVRKQVDKQVELLQAAGLNIEVDHEAYRL